MLVLNARVNHSLIPKVCTRIYDSPLTDDPQYTPTRIWVLGDNTGSVSMAAAPITIITPQGDAWRGYSPREIDGPIQWFLDGLTITLTNPPNKSDGSLRIQADNSRTAGEILKLQDVFGGLGYLLVNGTIDLDCSNPVFGDHLEKLMRQNPPEFTVNRHDQEVAPAPT